MNEFNEYKTVIIPREGGISTLGSIFDKNLYHADCLCAYIKVNYKDDIRFRGIYDEDGDALIFTSMKKLLLYTKEILILNVTDPAKLDNSVALIVLPPEIIDDNRVKKILSKVNNKSNFKHVYVQKVNNYDGLEDNYSSVSIFSSKDSIEDKVIDMIEKSNDITNLDVKKRK